MKKASLLVVLGATVLSIAIVVVRAKRNSNTEPDTGDIQKARADAVDLLSRVDLKQHSVKGTWELMGRALVSPSEKEFVRIQLPEIPPPEYTLTLEVERKGKLEAFIIGLTREGGQFLVMIDGKLHVDDELVYPICSAIRNVDGKPDNETVFRGQSIPDGASCVIECRVSSSEVLVTVDGRSTIRWRGELDRLTIPKHWAIPNPKALFLGSYNCQYVIHKALLTPGAAR